MKILLITNVFPPHHAGTYEFRCEKVAAELRRRGHTLLVLTSNHGLKTEQRGKEIERRLLLNGVYGHPSKTQFHEMKELEAHNNAVLRETVSSFKPDIVYLWSLHGLSKSLIFTLHQQGIPHAYDVADYWISNELNSDPWLSWWNRPKLSLAQSAIRSAMELSGQRDKLDEEIPTRDNIATKRLSHIYDSETDRTEVEPGSIQTFRLHNICFASTVLRDAAIQSGYEIVRPMVIHPGITYDRYHAELRPPEIPSYKLMMAGKLHKESGAMTVLEAFKHLYDSDPANSLTICGTGDLDFMAQMKSFATRHSLPVVFEAALDQAAELPKLYRAHDFFIHSAEWPEPYSVLPLEAMAAGMMVLSTGYGGTGELMQHGVNSLLYSAGNVLDLAQRIQYLQKEPATRLQLASKGQSEVREYHTFEKVMDRTEAFLLEAAKN